MRLYFDPSNLELFDDTNRDARALLDRGAAEYVRNECMRWMRRGLPGRVFRVMLPRQIRAHVATRDMRHPGDFLRDVVDIEIRDRRGMCRAPSKPPQKVRGIGLKDMMNFQWPRLADERDFERKMMHQMRDFAVANNMDIIPDRVARPKPLAPPMIDGPKQCEGSPSSVWKDGEHFIERLYKRGYSTLGAGAFSTVLAKRDSDRVVKVSRKPDPWLDYIVWANKEGFAGTLAPRVYSYRVIKGRFQTFYVAVMERLECTISQCGMSKPHAARAHNAMRHWISHKDDKSGLEAEKYAPGALRFGAAFRLAFQRNHDLHEGNFMLRKDGSLVCTDPIWNEDSRVTYSKPRMRSRDLEALRAA